MFDGVEVTVYPAALSEPDRYGNRNPERGEPVRVGGVLAVPEATADEPGGGAPHATSARMTLWFRRGTPGFPLRGAVVEVGGREYDVEGDPVPYPIVPEGVGYDLEARCVSHA